MKNSHQRITVNCAIFAKANWAPIRCVLLFRCFTVKSPFFTVVGSFVCLFVVPLSTWSLCVYVMLTLGLFHFLFISTDFQAKIITESSRHTHTHPPTNIHVHENWQNDGKYERERVLSHMRIFRILGLATNYTHTYRVFVCWPYCNKTESRMDFQQKNDWKRLHWKYTDTDTCAVHQAYTCGFITCEMVKIQMKKNESDWRRAKC